MSYVPRWEVSWYIKNVEDIGHTLVAECYNLEVVAIMAAWRHLKDGHCEVRVKEQHFIPVDGVHEWVTVHRSTVRNDGDYE